MTGEDQLNAQLLDGTSAPQEMRTRGSKTSLVDSVHSKAPNSSVGSRPSSPDDDRLGGWDDRRELLRHLELRDEKLIDRARDFQPFKVPHQFTPAERKRQCAFESIDYWEPQTAVYKDYLPKRKGEKRWAKWIVYALIGIAIGVWAGSLFQTLDIIVNGKQQALAKVRPNESKWRRVLGWLVWSGLSMLQAGLGSLLCAYFPSAAGSGVPEMIAYLNGVMLPKFFNIRNLVSKTFSLMLAVTSGLPVGAEGPMTHLGALIGAGICTGRSRTLKCSSGFFKSFRNPKDHRDFIAGGAAAGLTGAFGTPIAGLLFILEEVASFFPVKLAWMTFFCCVITKLVLQTINSYFADWKLKARGSLASTEYSQSAGILFDVGPHVPMSLNAIAPSIIIGVVMGLWAVAHTQFNVFVARCRARYVTFSTPRRVIEVIMASFVYSTLTYIVACQFDCVQKPPQGGSKELRIMFENSTDNRIAPLPAKVFWFDQMCNSTDYFNPYGTIAMTADVNAMSIMFSRHTSTLIPKAALLIHFILYSIFASYCAGIFVASGVMVSVSLIIGAAGGRIWGMLLQQWFPESTFDWADPGLFSLVGAAGFFGGLSRLTFSLTVLTFEVSNDLEHILLFMTSIFVAKLVADKFSHSLYHNMLYIKCVPFLDLDTQVHKLDTYSARDIMATPVLCLNSVETVEQIVKVLKSTKHHAYPITSLIDDTFKGTITREALSLLLWWTIKQTGEGTEVAFDAVTASQQRHATHEDLSELKEELFWGKLSEIPQFPDEMLDAFINLNPFIDTSAFAVSENMCISRTYLIFRSLGARHLIVVDRCNKVRGIITRKDLLQDMMMERVQERRKMRIHIGGGDDLGDGDESESDGNNNTSNGDGRATYGGCPSPVMAIDSLQWDAKRRTAAAAGRQLPKNSSTGDRGTPMVDTVDTPWLASENANGCSTSSTVGGDDDRTKFISASTQDSGMVGSRHHQERSRSAGNNNGTIIGLGDQASTTATHHNNNTNNNNNDSNDNNNVPFTGDAVGTASNTPQTYSSPQLAIPRLRRAKRNSFTIADDIFQQKRSARFVNNSSASTIETSATSDNVSPPLLGRRGGTGGDASSSHAAQLAFPSAPREQ